MKLKWKNGDDVTEKELEAIKEALMLCSLEIEDLDDPQGWIDDDTITLCEGRSKRESIWILDESRNVVVYIDDLSWTTDEKEIEEEFC